MATTRIGHAWTKQEEDSILADIEAGLHIGDIAVKQQRTAGGIRARLTRLACSFVEEKTMSLYEASGRTGIRATRIRDVLKRKTEQEKAKEMPPNKMEFDFKETFTREKLQGRAEEVKRQLEAAERLRVRQSVQTRVDHCILRAVLDAAATKQTSYLYDLQVNGIAGFTADDLMRGLREKFPQCNITLAQEWVDTPTHPGRPQTRTLKSGIKIDWS